MAKGKQPLLYVLSSVASWAVDTGGFFVLSLLFGGMLGAYSEPVCNVAARVISSFFNFNLNNRLVFQNSGSYGKALLRYYCLAVPQLAAIQKFWVFPHRDNQSDSTAEDNSAEK